MEQGLYLASVWLIPILVAITFHEAAHGYAAWYLGDDTARRMGRLTLNPLKHIDPFGTLILPALLLLVRAPFLFGYAKPVPVNFRALRNPRRDMVLVAAAGPAMNVALAVVAALLLHGAVLLPSGPAMWVVTNLANAILINLVLAVFNMMPLPPLDGGRVAVGLLPPALGAKLARLERFGFLILIALFFVLPAVADQFGLSMSLFAVLILEPVRWLQDVILIATGHGAV